MAILQPKVTGDGVQDSWAFAVTNETNRQEEILLSLLEQLENLPDGSSVDDLRDLIIGVLRQ